MVCLCPSIFLRLTLFSTDGFAGECCTTRKSSPSPIDSTRSVGFPRACPHSQTRPSVSGHGCVPVVSSLAGAYGRIWLEYWLHLILRLRRTVLRREYTRQGSYRAWFKNIYLAKWTRANGVSVADTSSRSDAISVHVRRRQLRWYATPRVNNRAARLVLALQTGLDTIILAREGIDCGFLFDLSH